MDKTIPLDSGDLKENSSATKSWHMKDLGMSVTTKSHLMEDHSLEQQEELNGIGDLGEDFGEQNHQDQAKADQRLGCI
jgi:hypothetical protein